MACAAATLADCALSVHATAVAGATFKRSILDSGSNKLTADLGDRLDDYGLIRAYPKSGSRGFAEEYGMLAPFGLRAEARDRPDRQDYPHPRLRRRQHG